MRELKFRVWDTKNKKWLDMIPAKEYMLDHDEWDRRDMENEDGGIHPNWIFINNFNGRLIFQQYTGLKDSQGKEIYEGDIVKYNTTEGEDDMRGGPQESIREVKYKDGAFYPRYINEQCDDSWYSFKVDGLDIIGNILENPTLLNDSAAK